MTIHFWLIKILFCLGECWKRSFPIACIWKWIFCSFQILTLRIVHEQQIRLLSAQEQRDLRTNEAFNSFMGLNPLQYNPYTQPLWNAAVAQYDRVMAPVEQKIAGKLKQQLRGLEGYPQQVRTFCKNDKNFSLPKTFWQTSHFRKKKLIMQILCNFY